MPDLGTCGGTSVLMLALGATVTGTRMGLILVPAGLMSTRRLGQPTWKAWMTDMNESLGPKEIKALEGFLKPRSPEAVASWSLWHLAGHGVPDVLDVIRGLQDRGLLREATRAERLGTWKVRELQEELKALGAATSGRKSELVERVLENLPESDLEDFDRVYDDLVVTAEGRAAFNHARDGYESRFSEAQRKSVRALREGDIDAAIKACDWFLVGEEFSFELLPMSFRRPPAPPRNDLLAAIARAAPNSLSYLSPSELGELRVGAMASTVWGNDLSEYLPSDFPVEPLPPKIAVWHLKSAAEIDRSREPMNRQVDLEHHDPRTAPCEQCAELVGRRYPNASLVPNLPEMGCDSPWGCPLRCAAIRMGSLHERGGVEAEFVLGPSGVEGSVIHK
jgi:hypothetical protein